MRRRCTLITTKKIHIMALDGIVNVNSLFTLALFLGLTWYPVPDPATTLVSDRSCFATQSVEKRLVSFHVYSFSSFLFSSLVALALKQAICIVDKSSQEGSVIHYEVNGDGDPLASVNLAGLRVGTLVSGFGSVFGCGFLTMALVDLVQMKLGTLSCGSVYTYVAIGPLVLLVPLALIFYVSLVLYAFTR